MPKPRFGCFLSALLLTATLAAATETPDSAEQQLILSKVRDSAARYLENLPNFVCARVTAQYNAGKKPEHWKQGDTLTERLIFNQGKENLSTELVNGKPIPPHRVVDRPLSTSGEFGGLVGKVLDEKSNAQISWSHWEDLRGQRLAVFAYVIDAAHSTLTLSLDGLDVVVPYAGLIYADPQSGEMWRITSTPFDIPRAVETKSVTTTIDYGPVAITNKRFILPVNASILLDTGHKNILNKVVFNEYRRFEAESRITFLTGSN